MCTFIIRETDGLYAYREGEKFVGTLEQAKSYARKNKCFNGTTLKIETPDGDLLAYKIGGGKWHDLSLPEDAF